MNKSTVQVDGFVPENTSKHYTNEYENGTLVLRRGNTFKIGLKFSGTEFAEALKTIVRISIDSSAENAKLLSKSCQAETSLDDSKWSMIIVEKDETTLKLIVVINIPVDVMIGRYNLEIVNPSSPSVTLKRFQIIVIFNPWNKDDEVYLEDEQLRKEYVLNDNGIVYRGDSHGPYPKTWNFGQFDEHVLDCTLLLLKKYHRKPKIPVKILLRSASPVWVSRWLSAVVNQQDDNGLLVGNWSDDYHGGAAPWAWNGSVEIFQKYYRQKKPVKYGQCWVFSGAMTTALRALGIPARSITNFESAHDTDGTMTIDVFYNEDNVEVEKGYDSVWNFHVWNEIWTKRKDLPGDRYDGWQAVDATPQEQSAEIFQMGPAPLHAVKEGEVYAGFDTGFVYAEVNALRVKWIVAKDKNGSNKLSKLGKTLNDKNIGKIILTKKVGSDEREDITHLYKYPEGSEEEKKAFNTAYSFGKGPELYPNMLNYEEEGNELTIEITTSPADDYLLCGDPFSCIVDVKNSSSDQNMTVDVTIVIHSLRYTGTTVHLVKKVKLPGIEIKPGESAKQELQVAAKEYLDKMTDMQSFKVVSLAKVNETGKRYLEDHTFYLTDKPCIDVKFQQLPLQVGKEASVQVTFVNPLPKILNGLVISIEGAGLVLPKKKEMSSVRNKMNVNTGETVTTEFTFVPKKAGKRMLQTAVSARRLPSSFTHDTKVNVLPKEE